MRPHTVFLTASLLLGAYAVPLHAQQAAPSRQSGPTVAELRRQQEIARRVPVTVALVDQLPAGSGDVPVVVLRRTNASPHDVILLRRKDASGAQLAGAIFHLMILRDQAGDTARANGLFRLPTAGRGPKAWERTEQVQTARIVAQLSRGELREIAGVGRVPAYEVFLPSRAMRDAARGGRGRSGL